MKTIYSHISPLTNAYVNFYHLFLLKEQKPNRVFLCVWDSYFFEDKRFLQGEDPKQLLKEYVANIEKVLRYLKLDYKIFYLSQAWERFFARPDLVKLFRKVLSSITFDDLKKKSDFQYSLFGETTLSRMEYMLADFLIATHFNELFPEYTQTMPHVYTTSERFKVFHEHILETLAGNYRKTNAPEVEYVTKLPIIVDAKGRIPSFDMSEIQVEEIIKEYLKKVPMSERLLGDFTPVFASVDLTLDKSEKQRILSDSSGVAFASFFSQYLKALKGIVERGDKKESLQSLFITSAALFEEKVKPLNELKLRILSLCDGSRTSYEIANVLKLKPVTVSVYFGRLKEMGLLTDGRRPKATVQTIVLDLKSLKV